MVIWERSWNNGVKAPNTWKKGGTRENRYIRRGCLSLLFITLFWCTSKSDITNYHFDSSSLILIGKNLYWPSWRNNSFIHIQKTSKSNDPPISLMCTLCLELIKIKNSMWALSFWAWKGADVSIYLKDLFVWLSLNNWFHTIRLLHTHCYLNHLIGGSG